MSLYLFHLFWVACMFSNNMIPIACHLEVNVGYIVGPLYAWTCVTSAARIYWWNQRIGEGKFYNRLPLSKIIFSYFVSVYIGEYVIM